MDYLEDKKFGLHGTDRVDEEPYDKETGLIPRYENKSAESKTEADPRNSNILETAAHPTNDRPIGPTRRLECRRPFVKSCTRRLCKEVLQRPASADRQKRASW